MAKTIEINTLEHPGVELFARLTEAQLRNRLEPEKGIFIAESPKVIRVALAAGCEPVALLTERKFVETQAAEFIDRCGDIPVYTGDTALLSQLAGYPLTRGVLCAMRRPRMRTLAEVCTAARRVAILDTLADATNIGALFRSAAALGIDGVLLTPTCCDPLNRRAMRVSMGTVLQVPWAYVGDDAAQWPTAAVAQLHTLGFRVAALALSDDSVPLDDPALRQEERLAIVLGAEGDGLPATVVEGCDYVVRIPMAHGVDSLNVAAAGAVAFWELRAAARARD
ncbi:MAG: RNA methyltransferase [Bacteroidales bacterium]|nr:RNA methyltransferase [Bacteroidales bacterium]